MIHINDISFIEEGGIKKAVIMSMDKFNEIQEQLEDAEDLADIASYDASNASNEETFPIELVEHLLLSDKSKIRVMREYRDYSATKLAGALNISESYLSQIEHKKRKGTIDFYVKCAQYLKVDIELLVD